MVARAQVIAQETYDARLSAAGEDERPLQLTQVQIDWCVNGALTVRGQEYTGGGENKLRVIAFPVRWLRMADCDWRRELTADCRVLREQREQRERAEQAGRNAEEEAQDYERYLALKARFEGKESK